MLAAILPLVLGRAAHYLRSRGRKHGDLMAGKSYWQEAYTGSDNAKACIKSWFGSMCEGLTPIKAEILCDIQTDREKKIRAVMADEAGQRYQLERTLGGATFSVSRKRL